MFRKIITYLTIYSFMFSNVCWAAMITPDGRTQTTVNVNGHVYDVTTSTVSGKNAFNSFSNFDVYKGTTVNLYLPGSTLNLINLVRDGKTNIDGILNSIKNGKIGGNVFILNPHPLQQPLFQKAFLLRVWDVSGLIRAVNIAALCCEHQRQWCVALAGLLVDAHNVFDF